MHERAFRDLRPLTPGNFGYSVLRSAVWSDFQRELLTCCDKMDFGLEGLHSETGPGVLEAAITVDEALASADKAALFKTFLSLLFYRCNWPGLLYTPLSAVRGSNPPSVPCRDVPPC